MSTKTVKKLTSCARCGGVHFDLLFMEFERPFAPEEAAPIVWNYWATCPVTQDPILLADPS